MKRTPRFPKTIPIIFTGLLRLTGKRLTEKKLMIKKLFTRDCLCIIIESVAVEFFDNGFFF